ncbi:NETI motif-containing protein [Cytobacillus firmus]|uniref:NETI motif-containing protein n=1 Tax=Cytobacillus TaxID=2675230 RepID=UPI00203FEC95|nr:NETI motif-containing protein [Cytobacillus oceanisediminis]MCM3245430.1 NETI motif-containing protein [Cytobacillus oceanisediminis]MCS0827244.1 NETI motif-containing protein [Cytobacillus firmus]
MSKAKNKMVFEVQENETIDQCLERIQKAGYIPVRRTEKPIFKEVKTGGKIDYEPAGRQIVFEAKRLED